MSAEVKTQTADMPVKTKKLHGRAFYESIGSPKLILAPMVEQSEFVRLGHQHKVCHANKTGRHGAC
jgi:hypothetical protein